ncbi:hypothetical protein OIY81_2259 [Cryptosporidium canis]|uniref:Peptidase M60 domain-containing protein n=1 Tax=Cryptosporidium canis TaxID=195482 RepID=A0ABQ8P7J7_9CRYT|nr:hypothetical protein OIY81_2259 [Cryptosporidium canis]KAJ1610456.1 hypothetical protein OJ252_1918 [Cryptosporidium canis]
MRISPRTWFLAHNGGPECSKFKIRILNKRCKRRVDVDNFKILICKDFDLIKSLLSGQINWELEDLMDFSRDKTKWEESDEFEIMHCKDNEEYLTLNFFTNYLLNDCKLFMLQLENDEYHIIDIIDICDNPEFHSNNNLVKNSTNLMRKFLLKGLNNMELNGTPGQIHCFGGNSIGLIGGGSDKKGSFSWCSGISFYGDGAILSFSHETFLLKKDWQFALSVVLENFYSFKQETKKGKNVGFWGFSEFESSDFIQNVNNGHLVYYRDLCFDVIEPSTIETCVNSDELDIIIINGNLEQKKSIHETKLSSRILKRFISKGKLLIIGLCPWGWEYTTCGKLDLDSISNDINKEMGMIFTNEYFVNEESYINIKNPSNYLSTFYYWRFLVNSINHNYIKSQLQLEEYLLMVKDIECHLKMGIKTSEQNKILNLIAEFLKKKMYLKSKPPFNMEDGMNILNLAISCSRLLEDKLDEVYSSGDDKCTLYEFDNWIDSNQFWKTDGCISNQMDNEPYDEKLILSKKELLCPIYDVPYEWQNTGVYIRHKDILMAELVLDNEYSSNPLISKIHIGCHSDFLRYKELDILKRLPLISKTYNWRADESNYIKIESPCDGIVYFEYAPEMDSDQIQRSNKQIGNQPHSCVLGMIKFTSLNGGVTLTPIYTIDMVLSESNQCEGRAVITDKYFWGRLFSNENMKFSKFLPEWLELHGKKIILTVPTRVLYRMDCIVIDDLLEFWDNVVDTQNELYFNYKWTKERIVCDVQIADGYMHSGYPIMTHLDIVEEQLETGGLLDFRSLKERGNWGIYHEIGHNRQSDYWTFSGTEEVTVNLFTMYSYYKLHPNIYPFKIEYVKEQINLGIEYLLEINSNKDDPERLEHIFKDKWMTNHGIAFCNYLILFITFGWDAFKAVFQIYDKLQEIDKDLIQVHDYQHKMSIWIVIFSSVVGVNLKNFFDQWGWWFCMSPRAESEIDILSLCVRLQNNLMYIDHIFVKRIISEEEIILGYEDLALINDWKGWDLKSLELLLDFQIQQ